MRKKELSPEEKKRLLEMEELNKQVEIPNTVPTYQGPGFDQMQGTDPCKNCPNNPKNNPNASGICCCALPYFANPIR